MTKPTKKKRLNRGIMYDGSTRINDLPGDVLSHIISSLSIDEAARSSILSKHWKSLCMNTFHLDLDQRKMMKPFSQLLNQRSGNENFDPSEEDMKQYSTLAGILLDRHSGELRSCHFKHFPRSLGPRRLEAMVELALGKYQTLSTLSLECESLMPGIYRFPSTRHFKLHFHPKVFSKLSSLEFTDYAMDRSTPLAFDGCVKLKILKLKKMAMEGGILDGILKNCSSLEKLSVVESNGFQKLQIRNPCLKVLELQRLNVKEVDISVEGLEVLIIESLRCPPEHFKINTSNLTVFHFGYKSSIAHRGMLNYGDYAKPILKTQEIFENFSNLFESNTDNIFRNLLSMSIDMDLNKIREAMALSYILRSCVCLQTLTITIPMEGGSASNGNYDDCALPFPKSMFWERREMYNCINYKVRYAKISGFKGTEQEVKFVKHLITRGTMMKTITIICNSSSIMEEANGLLALPRASINLSIILK